MVLEGYGEFFSVCYVESRNDFMKDVTLAFLLYAKSIFVRTEQVLLGSYDDVNL
jgi:hypothetical protein